MWRRLANATSRFFAPSKRQDSAPVEINSRQFDRALMQEVPAEYLVEDASETHISRTFANARLELHAQDRDHAGRGWAAVIASVSSSRIRLKLMEEVNAHDIWGHDIVNGDVTVMYERVNGELIPKEIHLNRVYALK